MSLAGPSSEPQKLTIKPAVADRHQILELALKTFGLIIEERDESAMEELVSYRDRNFYLKGFLKMKDSPTDTNDNVSSKTTEYLLKIMNSSETYDPDLLEAMDLAMAHINRQNYEFCCPSTTQSLSGDLKTLEYFQAPADHPLVQSFLKLNGINGGNLSSRFFKIVPTAENLKTVKNDHSLFMKHYVRLLTFLPGKPLACDDITDDLVYKAGQFTAKVGMSLKDLHHPALEKRQNIWDLKNITWLRGKYVDALSGEMDKKNLVGEVIDAIEAKLTPILSKLPTQTIHGDLSVHNILVENVGSTKEITGLIDFGELDYSCRVFDLGICIAYMSIQRYRDPLNVMGLMFAGYLSECELTDQEVEVLYICIMARLVQSLVMGNYQATVLDPGNEYALVNAKNGWPLLRKLWSLTETEVQEIWKANS